MGAFQSEREAHLTTIAGRAARFSLRDEIHRNGQSNGISTFDRAS
ncbi:MAG: hypothetical protein AAF436_20570 [Myxococcota bacterium]